MQMSNKATIRWTRQADGSYTKEGTLPADIPTARIYVIDDDYETNPHAVCPGLKLWPNQEAIELVERKIAEGSYSEWRYELRPEVSNADANSDPAFSELPRSAQPRTCSNFRCKKGPEGTPGAVTNRKAKYCCAACRVTVCRRNKLKPQRTDGPARKPRRDKKHESHAARQSAYEWRKWGRERLSRMM
jgi:hypothetical protein